MWDKFLASGYIKSVDLALATQLSGNNALSPPLEALLVHLSVAMRQGHVCIDNKMDCRPIWEQIEPFQPHREEDSKLPSDEDWENLTLLVREGMRSIPPHLSQIPNDSEPLNLKPIVIHGSRIYSQRCWLAESQFKNNLTAFFEKSKQAPFTISEEEIAAKLCRSDLENRLLPEQKEAILRSAAPLSLLAGGPGTGKTYTAGRMISILAELLQEKLGRPASIALAAPTGKAALHLENSVQTAKYTGVTLHALLSKLPLQTDLIVVDEASMIDLEWMGKLLKELPLGARLILIGDPHQLPPVGMGSIFVDMIQTMPHTHLTQCLRTDLQEIVTYAHAIKNGVYTRWEHTFPLQDDHLLISRCVEHYSTFTTLQDFNRFKVLSPFTKGPFGTEQLNQKILTALKNPIVIPILITKNDYELELFNGEQGLWIPSRKVVQFPKKGSSGIREIPLSLIGAYQLGYCLTIHKSQGSEYAHVLVVYPEGAQIFGKEALYTAVTRAKQTLEIYASQTILQQAVQKNTRRMSGAATCSNL